MTIGVLRNYLGSGAKLMDFTPKDLEEAYRKVLTINTKFTDEFTLIDILLKFYRIHNMDIGSMVDSLKTDRNGVFKGIGKFAFLTSTLGDKFNRSAMLIAKMIHDGSFEAHKLEGEKLIYDPTKDKRFSYYLSNRESYKNSDGTYKPKPGDEKYNSQRRLYLAVVDQLNKEATIINGAILTERDLIPKAYSQKERNSLKAQADLIYGAYDKDSQPQILQKLAGISYLQFMQF